MAKLLANTYSNVEEKIYRAKSGWLVLFLSILAYVAAIVCVPLGGIYGMDGGNPLFVALSSSRSSTSASAGSGGAASR